MHPLMDKRVRDRVTGFEGTVTARYEFHNGCVQYLVVGSAKKDGDKAPDDVFDEQRLVMQNPHGKGEIAVEDFITGAAEADARAEERQPAPTGGGFRRHP